MAEQAHQDQEGDHQEGESNDSQVYAEDESFDDSKYYMRFKESLFHDLEANNRAAQDS